LTEVIESIVRDRAQLDDYERGWERAREKVIAERRNRPAPEAEDLRSTLREMPSSQLLEVLDKVPASVLRRILAARSKS